MPEAKYLQSMNVENFSTHPALKTENKNVTLDSNSIPLQYAGSTIF